MFSFTLHGGSLQRASSYISSSLSSGHKVGFQFLPALWLGGFIGLDLSNE